MQLADKWKDYELIDAGDGEKLERWGDYILRRPDPQAIWAKDINILDWKKADANYHRSKSGGGSWEYKTKVPVNWRISYEGLKFIIQPTGFKHTGLFPEQAVNWDWMIKKINDANRPIEVLNLFGYTGGATVACAYAKASVCHVDASKAMVLRAKENVYNSNITEASVRYITDDVFKFVQREAKRGKKYEAIIMDPPSYGRGPNKEVWKIENELVNLINACLQILSDKPLFLQINSYTAGFSPTVIENILRLAVPLRFKGKITSDEIGIKASRRKIILPAGVYARWEEF
jgi:23S rRNA (cytosine1962-C5)-methyltransferase